MNPSLEASWRHPWRQDLHTETAKWLRGSLRVSSFLKVSIAQVIARVSC
ncbi:hypothetical protein [Halorhodospira halochloris]|nr:hypothetical protein [Halorhodospira halochloris]